MAARTQFGAGEGVYPNRALSEFRTKLRGRHGGCHFDLEQIASFMNRAPLFISFGKLQLHGFIAKVTKRRVRDGSHRRPPLRIIRLHKRPTPEMGTAERCVRRPLDSNTRLRQMYVRFAQWHAIGDCTSTGVSRLGAPRPLPPATPRSIAAGPRAHAKRSLPPRHCQ